jgi:hypothetical protein
MTSDGRTTCGQHNSSRRSCSKRSAACLDKAQAFRLQKSSHPKFGKVAAKHAQCAHQSIGIPKGCVAAVDTHTTTEYHAFPHKPPNLKLQYRTASITKNRNLDRAPVHHIDRNQSAKVDG